MGSDRVGNGSGLDEGPQNQPAREDAVAEALRGDSTGARKKSYLDAAAESTVQPVFTELFGRKAGETMTGFTKELVKTTPLFMRGKLPIAGMAATFAADEAKVGDSLSQNLLDGGLGVAKSVALRGSFQVAQHYKLTPSMTGISLGVMGRFSDTALSSSTWLDANGQFNANAGLRESFKLSIRPEMLAMDAASFGAADVLWGRLYSRTRGAAYYNPVVTHTLSGLTMGATNGGGMELYRQVQTGKIDPLTFLEKTTGGALVNGLAGAMGGYQSRYAARLDYSSRSEFNTRPQKEHTYYSDAQRALQTGEFVQTGVNAKLTQEAWSGKVVMPDGSEVRTIFRPDNGTPAFRDRMLAETSITALDALTGRAPSTPVAVARTVEINGKQVSGFIQEMAGKDLRAYLSETAIAKYGSDSNANMLKVFNENPQLKQSFGEALARKAFEAGEWDNHALNQLVVETPTGPKVKNIDLQDALKPAKHAWDLQPDSGYLRGWEGLNKALYKEFAGTPIPGAVRQQAKDFLMMFDNPIGRMRLQEATGWSYQQMEGVLGRNRYLAQENSVYPRPQQESIANPMLSKVKHFVKTGSLNRSLGHLADLRVSEVDVK